MSTQARETETINRSVTVDCAVEHAFATFTERINSSRRRAFGLPQSARARARS